MKTTLFTLLLTAWGMVTSGNAIAGQIDSFTFPNGIGWTNGEIFTSNNGLVTMTVALSGNITAGGNNQSSFETRSSGIGQLRLDFSQPILFGEFHVADKGVPGVSLDNPIQFGDFSLLFAGDDTPTFSPTPEFVAYDVISPGPGELFFDYNRALGRPSFGGSASGTVFLNEPITSLEISTASIGDIAEWAFASSFTTVPEPSTLTLMAIALAGVGVARRRAPHRGLT